MKNRKATENFDTTIKATWFIPEESFEFVTLPYQRTVTLHHVNKIKKSLEQLEDTPEGAHFTEPLVVNVRSTGKVALLDGYHRFEAMRRYGKKVKIKIEIYKDLSLEEEKSIYEDYNIGKSHSPMDIIRPKIKNHKGINTLLKECKIPITDYTNRQKGISLTSFLNAYKRSLWEEDKGRNHLTLIEFILDTVDKADADILVKWSKWYVDIVGDYNIKSEFYNTNFISVILYIYRNTARPDLLQKRLANLKFDAYFKQVISSSSSYAGFKLLLEETKTRINKNLHRKII